MNRCNWTYSHTLSLLCITFVLTTQLNFVTLGSRNFTPLSSGCFDSINNVIQKLNRHSTKNRISSDIQPIQNDEHGQILGHR